MYCGCHDHANAARPVSKTLTYDTARAEGIVSPAVVVFPGCLTVANGVLTSTCRNRVPIGPRTAHQQYQYRSLMLASHLLHQCAYVGLQ
jgi:hypothetical protein